MEEIIDKKANKKVNRDIFLGWLYLIIPLVMQGTGFSFTIAVIFFISAMIYSIVLISKGRKKPRNNGIAIFLLWILNTLSGISPLGILFGEFYL